MIAKKMDILTEAESQVGDLVEEEDVELEAATVFLTMYSRTQNDFITICMGSFKKQVDNRGWVGGLKFAIFVHV